MNKLNIGAGPNPMAGWTNVDLHPIHPGVAFMDARRAFPFNDGTFDRVYSEHMIEHVSFHDGKRMLQECFRVLCPGGRIRISTPDLDFLWSLRHAATAESQRYVEWACEHFSRGQPVCADTVINNFVRAWGHQYIWSKDVLEETMEFVGFRSFVWPPISESSDEAFAGLENASRMPEGFLQLETMTVEAEKL